jgi:hypothetical protein
MRGSDDGAGPLQHRAANAYWTDPAGNGPAERSWNFMAEWLSVILSGAH